MKKQTLLGIALSIALSAALLAAAPISIQWSPAKTLTVSLNTADARIGRPLTPGMLPALIGEFTDAHTTTTVGRREQPLPGRIITAGQLAATILIRLATECVPPLACGAEAGASWLASTARASAVFSCKPIRRIRFVVGHEGRFAVSARCRLLPQHTTYCCFAANDIQGQEQTFRAPEE